MTRPLRSLSLVLAILISFSTLARDRAAASSRPAVIPAVVTGTVSSVSGNVIAIGNGTITIDASGAKVVGRRGEVTTAAVAPGMQIVATLAATAATSGALPATLIIINELPELTLSGQVQSVDRANNTFQLLGRTIHVTSETSFSGRNQLVQVNELVQVSADVQGTRIVAESVFVLAPFPAPTQLLHGTVKSIGSDAWVITDRSGAEVRVVVNAQTRFTGNAKVGDTVEIIAITDSANQYVAVAIAKFEQPVLPEFRRISGGVKTINGTTWTILEGRTDVAVEVNSRTKLLGDPKVGDAVEVLAQRDGEKWVAISVIRVSLRF
jgi:hypothetical protein